MPDLMLLDINMPDIDGWSVLRSLKEDGLTSKIKVMMLTAYTDIGTDIFGLQDVVSGYIRKPFTNAELSEKIKEIVEGQETITLEPKMEEQKPSLLSRLIGRKETPVGMEKVKRTAKRSATWSRRPNRRSRSRSSLTRSLTTSRVFA
jgi:DNA-binding response OmpR family regulator